MSRGVGVALLGLLLVGCATPAPFYYCIEVTLTKGDRSVNALECHPQAVKVPWGQGAQGRELFEP